MISLVVINREIFSEKDIQSWCSRYRIQRIIVFSNNINNNSVKKMSLKLHKPSDVKLNLIADSNLEYFLKKICFIDENLMLIFDDAVTMSRIIKEMNYKEKVFINDFLLTNKTINPYYSNSEIIDAIKTLLESNNNVIFKKNIYSSEVNVARYLYEGVK